MERVGEIWGGYRGIGRYWEERVRDTDRQMREMESSNQSMAYYGVDYGTITDTQTNKRQPV